MERKPSPKGKDPINPLRPESTTTKAIAAEQKLKSKILKRLTRKGDCSSPPYFSPFLSVFSGPPLPHNNYNEQQEKKLIELLAQEDWEEVERRAGREGLASERVRRVAWPALMRVAPVEKYWEIDTMTHREENIVHCDVERSFTIGREHVPSPYLPPQRCDRKRVLRRLLNVFFGRNPDLYYYQGFHDIVVVFLITCGESATLAILERLCRSQLRLFNASSLSHTQEVLDYLFPLLSKVDVELSSFLIRTIFQPHFALSWLITWFAHNVEDFSVVTRLFDLFLSSPSFMPIHFITSLLLYYKSEIMSQPEDMAEVHTFLLTLGGRVNKDNVEELIETALSLSKKFPITPKGVTEGNQEEEQDQKEGQKEKEGESEKEGEEEEEIEVAPYPYEWKKEKWSILMLKNLKGEGTGEEEEEEEEGGVVARRGVRWWRRLGGRGRRYMYVNVAIFVGYCALMYHAW